MGNPPRGPSLRRRQMAAAPRATPAPPAIRGRASGNLTSGNPARPPAPLSLPGNGERGHRHRAGVQDDPRRRRPALRRSSRRRRRGRSSVHAPRAPVPAVDGERVGHVRGAVLATELELGRGRPRAPDGRHGGKPQVPPRPPGPAAPPGRSRAPLADAAWTGTWTSISPPIATSAHRAAAAAPRGAATRRSPPYFRAWSASRTTPRNGAHHSSWTSGSGTSEGIPRATPPGSPRRTSRAAAQPAHSGLPSVPQPAQDGGNARSRRRPASACGPHLRSIPAGPHAALIPAFPPVRRSSRGPRQPHPAR